MDSRGQRPPRAHRPSYSQYSQQPLSPTSPPSYIDQPGSPYSPYSSHHQSYESGRSANNVSFQTTERGDRRAPLDQPGRVRQHSAYQNVSSLPSPDPETGYAMADTTLVGRKKSLVRPDREKIEPGHRQWHYRSHAARLEDTNANLVQPSSMFYVHPNFYAFVNTCLLSHRQCPCSPSPGSVSLGS
jgi:chitin synthase